MAWNHAELLARTAIWRREAARYSPQYRSDLYHQARQCIYEARARRIHGLEKGYLP